MELTLSGPDLPVSTATRRLVKLLGAGEPQVGRSAPGQQTAVLSDGGDAEHLNVDVSWYGPSALGGRRSGGEASVQAISGLMQVHGRDAGIPRRLGLEVASVTAGVLTSHAVLACLVARARGWAHTRVETSVLQAAVQLMSHYVAAATCADAGEWQAPPALPSPGPPFRTADGCCFEIETFSPAAWRRFWFELGAVDLDLSSSWTRFRSRYFRGRCSLPPQVHEAAARHTLEKITSVARECGVSLMPVRNYRDVLADPTPTSELACIETVEATPDAGVQRAAAHQHGALPLEGVEVVEATSRIQGPLAGLLLQMLGAHVVRVEPPGGDPIRLVPPYAGSDGYFFTAFNRGKDAVELNLATEPGRRGLLDLLAGADLFLHNWGPGRADAWGLNADAVVQAAPRVTYVETSGWGDDERNRRIIGTEFLVQAASGLASGLTPEGVPPAPSRVLLVDCLGALVACEGALAGLVRAAQSGRGVRVGASLMAGAMALQTHVLDAIRAGDERSRCEGRPRWGALDRPLRAADGFLAVDVQDADDVHQLARVVGVAVDDSVPTPRLEDEIALRLRDRPAGECEETLSAAGVACAAVTEDLAAMASDPRLAMLFEQVSDGCRVAATPWRFAA